MEKQNKKYEVQVMEKVGTCDSTLFEKMAIKGDLTSHKVTELLNIDVKITGYAKCHIATDDKEFDIYYFDTEEYGLVSTGSEIFAESVRDYYGEVEYVTLAEIKTKKGKTYKAVPVLGSKKQTTKENEETNNEDLPF